MDQKFQSSLIPKKQSYGNNTLSRVKKPGTIFYWIGIGLFFTAVIASVGFFVYERVLLSQIAQKKFLIQKEIENFDPELTESLSDIKDRIDSGEEIVSKHLATSLFFSLLESLTVKGVQFTEFDFGIPVGERASFTAKGEAPSYAVLAFQSDVLEDSEYMLNPEFSEINLNEKGRVIFSLTAEMDSRAILYQAEPLVLENTETLNATTTDEETNNNEE